MFTFVTRRSHSAGQLREHVGEYRPEFVIKYGTDREVAFEFGRSSAKILGKVGHVVPRPNLLKELEQTEDGNVRYRD